MVEDVVQDVMIDLWTRHDTLAVQGNLRGYLFGAVRLRAANMNRRDSVAQRAAASVEDSQPHSAVDPLEHTETEELRTAINDALATLPERSRLILTMRWMDGLSYPEIAAALGTSVDAAKKQGRRIELIVRNLLGRFAP
jgi:RNA polymerase sigma-70 factor (ECF subfamily)